MTIYPIKNNLVGKPATYIGPFVTSKYERVGAKVMMEIKLPKTVRHVDPSNNKSSWTNKAFALV